MKKAKRRLMKAIFSLVCCLAMVITCVPGYVYAASSGEGEDVGEKIFNQLTNLGEPEGYDEDDLSNPYGSDDQAQTLLKNSGVVISTTSKEYYSQQDQWDTKYFWLDGYTTGNNIITSKTDWEIKDPETYGNVPNWRDADVSLAEEGQRDQWLAEYSYISSVALDPEGDGTNNIVAYIGVSREKDEYGKFLCKVRVWTLDTSTYETRRTFENNETTLGTATWIAEKDYYSEIRDYNTTEEGLSYFSITAGDYDNDGKDTIVAYACLDGEDYGVFQLSYDNGKLTLVNEKGDKTLLNPSYNERTELHNVAIETYYSMGYKLKGDVTTGDLDNDGIDDLVVSSGMGETDSDVDKDDVRKGYAAISLGEDDMSGNVVSKSNSGIYIGDNSCSLTNIQGDIGNVFTDGYNRLTVAGHKLSKDDSGKWQLLFGNSEDSQNTETKVYWYKMKDGELTQCGTWETTTPYDQFYYGDIVEADLNRIVPVCSAAVDGKGQQEQLFINGQIIKMQTNGVPQVLSSNFLDGTGEVTRDGSNMYLFEATPVSLECVSGGSSSSPGYGIEIFALSFYGRTGYDQGGESYNYYTQARCAFAYGNASYDNNGRLTPTTKYSVDEGYTVGSYSRVGNFEWLPSMTIAAVETQQSDVLRVKLNNKGYYYSNPEPTVVLQAAPYFSETGNEYSGQTQYTQKTTYTTGSSSADFDTIGTGYSKTLQLGFFKGTFTSSSRNIMTTETKNSATATYETSFTATYNDTVVVQRIPVVFYSYDVYDSSSGQWQENQMGVTVAKEPVLTQITVDEYNAFVNYYNGWVNEHVKKYTYDGKECEAKAEELNAINTATYYLDSEGNPDLYCIRWTDLPNGMGASKATMDLGYQSGYTTNNYGYETEETTTHINYNSTESTLDIEQEGLSAGFLDTWQGSILNELEGSVNATFETNGEGYSISGTVQNLDMAEMTKSGQLSEEAVLAYNFKWTFGLCDFNAHSDTVTANDSSNIPVVCYVVNNVKKGISIPTLDSVVQEEKVINVSWTAPETKTGETIEGYDIYVGDIDGNFTKITDEPLSATETTYSYTPTDATKMAIYSFIVCAVGKNSSTRQTIASLPSNTKSVIYSNDALIDELESRVTELESTAKDLQDQIDAAEDKEASDIEALKTELESVKTELTEKYDALIDALETRVDTLESTAKDLQEQIDAAEGKEAADIEALKTELANTNAELANQRAALEALEKSSTEQINALQKEIDEAEAKIAELESQVAEVNVLRNQLEWMNAELMLDPSSYTYTGVEIIPTYIVQLQDGTSLTKDVDYTVAIKNNVNAGTATMTVIPAGKYAGVKAKTATFKINKASQKLSTKVYQKTVRYAKVKKAKYTMVAIKAKSSIGAKITYKVTRGSKASRKYLSVNSKTGKVTVKKGTPKGTYKLNVKLTAAGNKNYKAAAKTVKVIVKVK